MRRTRRPILRFAAMLAALPVLLVLLIAHHVGEWVGLHAGCAFDRILHGWFGVDR